MDISDSEERQYFGRQKPIDEYVMGTIQDAFERKLNKMIDDRDKKPELSVREEINGLVCGNRTTRRSLFGKKR